jgi:small redox-active disulfide protein 2
MKMDIKILGSGCTKCQLVEKIVKEAVEERGINATIEKVKDIKKITEYGVFTTPSVIIDGEVKAAGKIPKKEEVLAWLGK